MNKLQRVFISLLLVFMPAAAFAQGSFSVKASLQDKETQEVLSFATVSLTRPGQTEAYKYVLSDAEGRILFEKVRKGDYILKAEVLGYKILTHNFSLKDKDIDLGVLKMEPDMQQLNAATVSAVGNAIIVKKDTVEYNASSFKTTENDVLEDLLKKLPGVEVSEDGTITQNGQEIKKITIDGKTFFLDDPSLASKNLPAKMIQKVKVVNKKSDQAMFTGIDDGEEETIIDLSVKPGMMHGTFGNIALGGGHDVPSTGVDGDYRYQGNGFIGRFRDDSQISIILNANNTNNRGARDMAGNMMGGMMGGGGMMGRGMGGWGNGNGITTSYMGGLNGAFTLFDDAMNLGGNYLYNGSRKEVMEKSDKASYMGENTMYSHSEGESVTNTGGNRFGMRLEHKFSENTSVIFEPQVNFGGGSFLQKSSSFSGMNSLDNTINESSSLSSGENKNWNASGFALLRQRLGKAGRTLTVMSRFSFSNNDLFNGVNKSLTTSYDEGKPVEEAIDQVYDSNSKTKSLMGRFTYTEPIMENFFLEANYTYNWNRTSSEKHTYDVKEDGQVLNQQYSNSVVNDSKTQNIGANLVYQQGKGRAQLGFSAIPTLTSNETSGRDPYQSFVWRYSPQAMFFWDFSDNANARVFYRGNSSQPSVNKLMPVPDITDPLNISFGNPTLLPYFSHSLRGDYRFNNRQTFTSFNVHFEGGMTQDPIVSLIWYGSNGGSYNLPVNGPASGNASFNCFLNTPIAKSNFSISNMIRGNWNTNSSYIGTGIQEVVPYDPVNDYYDFMNYVVDKFNNDEEFLSNHVTKNTTTTYSATDRIRLTYKNDNLEIIGSARSRMNYSVYSISTTSNTLTFNNQIQTSVNWTWEQAGLTIKSDFNYNWYNGYATAHEPEYILNAEIQKSIFHKICTLSLKGYDILGQAKNLSISDNANFHTETVNNTLGRYIIASLTFRFGSFGGMKGMGGPGMPPMGPHGPRR